MRFVQHPTNNAVLGAPPGWDQEQLPCNALPVTRTHQDGAQTFVSFWKPSDEELKAINAGAHVALFIFGDMHPPVALEVTP